MPQPGNVNKINTSQATGGSFRLPYPTAGGGIIPYLPGSNNNVGGYPPYPTSSANAMPAATSGINSGFPPYMNFPPVPGYNSGYVSIVDSFKISMTVRK